MKRAIFLTALVLSLLTPPCFAGAADTYMVSGVLRKNSDGMVIKLVHAMRPASSANEAVGSFTRDVLSQYPGYSLVDAIASPVERPAGDQCGKVNAI